MSYQKILVALDGSEESERGFQKAIEIAKENHASLLLTHVFDLRLLGGVAVYDNTLVERAEKSLKEIMNAHLKLAQTEGIENVSVCIEYGSPKFMIPCKIAPDNQVDLIICGVTGRNAIERFLVGSVSKEIIKYAKCDVLVIR